MSPTFKKLNLKDQSRIAILNAPASFETEVATLDRVTVLRKLEGVDAVEFSLAFCHQAEASRFAG
jgi:hypothetical protein